jgi:hypothetical protein
MLSKNIFTSTPNNGFGCIRDGNIEKYLHENFSDSNSLSGRCCSESSDDPETEGNEQGCKN